MDDTTQAVARPPRLNPFAFPSDTDFRFVLLIVTVLGASLFIYNSLSSQTHAQELNAAVSCVRHRASNQVALNSLALQMANNVQGQCLFSYQRISAAYMIGGAVLVIAVSACIYWLFPFWKLWHGNLVPLSDEDSPELMAYLAELCREARLARPPSFVCNPFNQNITGLAFGRLGRYYVALSGGLVTLFSTDRASFRAIVLHELAHLRNADVNKTYFAIASWWAFVIVALVPFTVISTMHFSRNPDFLLNQAWRVLVLAVLVFLALAAILRIREFYADVRAADWDDSPSYLLRVLNTLKTPKKRWQMVLHVHPTPSERYRTLNETDRLFRMGLWEATSLGIAVGIAAPNVLDLLDSLFTSLPPQVAAPGRTDFETFGATLLFAPLIVMVAGLGTWRMTFAALARGQVPHGSGRAGLCIGLGLILGTFLSLSADNVILTVNTSLLSVFSVFALSLPWSMVVLASLFLFLRWVAAGALAWLEVAIASRSPRLIYTVGLVVASVVLVVFLAQLLLLLTVATFFYGPVLANPSDLLTGVVEFTVLSILLLIYDILLSPGTLLAFICLWAFPLAAWFWRKQVTTPAGSNWAFLDASTQHVTLPHQDPFRLRFALLVGLVGGLTFCGLLLFMRIGLDLIVPNVLRSTNQFRLLLGTIQIVLAVLLQTGIAGIVAARVRRLGGLHSLFAAFVGGCVMIIGIFGLDLLFGGTIHPDFAWTLISWVVNGGALLALPITLIISVIVHHTRESRREGVTL